MHRVEGELREGHSGVLVKLATHQDTAPFINRFLEVFVQILYLPIKAKSCVCFFTDSLPYITIFFVTGEMLMTCPLPSILWKAYVGFLSPKPPRWLASAHFEMTVTKFSTYHGPSRGSLEIGTKNELSLY